MADSSAHWPKSDCRICAVAEVPRERGTRISCAWAWQRRCLVEGMTPKRFVYILRSAADPTCHYVGLTSNLPRRLAEHNAGRSPHTRELRPWRAVVTIEFASETPAVAFERYLKSGSGRAFASRHFN